MHVLIMGDRLLQRGTIYGAHRMYGGTIYDDTGGVMQLMVPPDHIICCRR
jgi:hypothetical protein